MSTASVCAKRTNSPETFIGAPVARKTCLDKKASFKPWWLFQIHTVQEEKMKLVKFQIITGFFAGVGKVYYG
jgi:hypothetical protein